MKGGLFGFTPALPVNNEMEILFGDDAKPNVVALFTDGNMKDMRVEGRCYQKTAKHLRQRLFGVKNLRTSSLRIEPPPFVLRITPPKQWKRLI